MRLVQVTFLLCILYQVLGGRTQNGPTTPHQLISQSSNKFTIDMYNVMKDGNDNILVSPFSAEVLLALLHLGSKGQVANEIKTALHFPNNQSIIKEGFKELVSRAENSEPLEIATRMFAAHNFNLKGKFLADAQNYFYSGIENVDFARKPEEAVKTINSFVAEKTHDKIKKLFDSVPSSTVLVLVNALYFKADWKYTFEHTYQEKFFVTKDNSETVDMMVLTEHFNYKHDDALGAQILELPYKGEEYSMIIILPDQVDGLHSVENKLARASFDGMYNTEVVVRLPKFKMEKEIKLNDILMKLGMGAMFGSGADLSGIADGPLSVSEAIQKTYINVDEKGTEAAAATGFYLIVGGATEEYFRADHPFMFAIVRKPENFVLFLGRLVSLQH